MAEGVNYWIVTVYDDDGNIAHFNWEIITRSVIIKNKSPIKSDKNSTYISLAWHVKKFLSLKLNPQWVKNRKEGSAGYEEHS